MQLTKKFVDTGRRLSPFHGYEQKPGKNYFEFRCPQTTLRLHGGGLGDLMIMRQFGSGFIEYVSRHGDPELGDVVISCGAQEPAFHPLDGDINLHWWWSFGPFEDEQHRYLDAYCSQVTVEPDAILAASQKAHEEAEQAGYDALYLPLGSHEFEPLGFVRQGLGYAGTKHHKLPEKERAVVGPFTENARFEWVSHFTVPSELNAWYNTKAITFGLTKESQRQWGMVNNRVFETLASGTPMILESHPTVEDVLEFDFPYQTDSTQETKQMVREMMEDLDAVQSRFETYSEKIRKKHNYVQRSKSLINFLN